MRRRIVIGAAVLVVLLLPIALGLVLLEASSRPGRTRPVPRPRAVGSIGARAEPPRDQEPRAAAPAAAAAPAPARGEHGPDGRSITVEATIEPAGSVDVVAVVSGRIRRLGADIGSVVRSGDVLAEVDAPELRLGLDRARAALEQAKMRAAASKAEIKVADAAVRTAQAELELSQAELKQAAATAVFRKHQYGRIAELVKKGALQNNVGAESAARAREEESREETASTRVNIMRAALLAAESKLDAASVRAGEAEAGVPLAELDVAQARSRLDACRIVAPIDGLVTRRRHDVGDFVRSAVLQGPDPLFTIVSTRTVRAVALVPDRDAGRVDLGDPATFRPGASPDREIRGSVSRRAIAEDPATQTMRAEVDLENREGRLRPGQRGTVRIELEPAP